MGLLAMPEEAGAVPVPGTLATSHCLLIFSRSISHAFTDTEAVDPERLAGLRVVDAALRLEVFIEAVRLPDTSAQQFLLRGVELIIGQLTVLVKGSEFLQLVM